MGHPDHDTQTARLPSSLDQGRLVRTVVPAIYWQSHTVFQGIHQRPDRLHLWRRLADADRLAHTADPGVAQIAGLFLACHEKNDSWSYSMTGMLRVLSFCLSAVYTLRFDYLPYVLESNAITPQSVLPSGNSSAPRRLQNLRAFACPVSCTFGIQL